MQTTTGFKFSLLSLLKAKVGAGLPKSPGADRLCFWGLAQARQLQEGTGLMAPCQIGRASWAVGRVNSVATRIGSPKPGQGVEWRGQETQMAGRRSGSQALHPKGLKKARGRAAHAAPYLSSHGRLGTGAGWAEPRVRTRRKDSPSEMEIVKAKLSSPLGPEMALGQEMLRECPSPQGILWFCSLLGRVLTSV